MVYMGMPCFVEAARPDSEEHVGGRWKKKERYRGMQSSLHDGIRHHFRKHRTVLRCAYCCFVVGS
jgi:hypothetical protein